MRNIKGQIFGNYNIAKIYGSLCKTIRLKTDYDKVQGLIWKRYRLFLYLLKIKGFPTILVFFEISRNCLCIWKVMGWVYVSRDHGWLLVHGGLVTIRGFGGHHDSSKREREVGGVLTNDATLRQSCGDDHTTALNRGDRWCFDGEMVLGVRRRVGVGVGAMDNEGALVAPFIGP
jgi:hypothetical protein